MLSVPGDRAYVAIYWPPRHEEVMHTAARKAKGYLDLPSAGSYLYAMVENETGKK
jgi:hypothetical protein